MRPIEQATERLNLAIERLERAVSPPAASNGKPDPQHAALTAMQSEQASLQKVVDTVAHRLDLAIGRLKLILEN
jgi:hypothetical protein